MNACGFSCAERVEARHVYAALLVAEVLHDGRVRGGAVDEVRHLGVGDRDAEAVHFGRHEAVGHEALVGALAGGVFELRAAVGVLLLHLLQLLRDAVGVLLRVDGLAVDDDRVAHRACARDVEQAHVVERPDDAEGEDEEDQDGARVVAELVHNAHNAQQIAKEEGRTGRKKLRRDERKSLVPARLRRKWSCASSAIYGRASPMPGLHPVRDIPHRDFPVQAGLRSAPTRAKIRRRISPYSRISGPPRRPNAKRTPALPRPSVLGSASSTLPRLPQSASSPEACRRVRRVRSVLVRICEMRASVSFIMPAISRSVRSSK